MDVKENVSVKQDSPRRIGLDVFMACWGLGTWLGVNGLYVQLPLLVEQLPEEWALPASMTLAVQLANIGLLIYALLRRFIPKSSDAMYIYSLLVIGTLALTLNAFLYSRTALISGTERSVAFLALTFFAALVGCTSSVLFYPYLRHYRDIYLATYLVGEGMSGFIPSILALIQGISGEPECVPGDDGNYWPVYPPPRFGIMTFFLILGGLSALSLAGFSVVHSAFRSERVTPSVEEKEDMVTKRESFLLPKWISVLVLMACLNALMNGALPSIQSYSCLPYGSQAYHLSLTLGAMANPAACMAGVWLRPMPTRMLSVMLSGAAVPLGYILATALLSPAPPLHHDPGGVALVVLSWVCVSAVLSYSRMWVYTWARRGGARGMRAVGLITQIGSSTGSLLLFALVNYTNTFTQPDTCPAPAAL